MLHKETIDSKTLELLIDLQKEPLLSSFNLVGGTVLALHLGHRRSVDLDFFTSEAFDLEEVKMMLVKNYDFKVSYSRSQTIKGFINDIKVDFIFEVVRRNPGWEEKFMEKMKLYEEFYDNYQAKDCGFDKRPQLVIIGEDDAHIIELFKDVKRINVELKGIEIYYSTDLRQLESEIDKTLITFKQDPETGRYRMEMAEISLLEGEK